MAQVVDGGLKVSPYLPPIDLPRLHAYGGVHTTWCGCHPIWEDQEGRKYYCECQIDDDHLTRIIHMLEHTMPPYPMLTGEMAQFFADQEWERAMDDIDAHLDLMRQIRDARTVKHAG